MINVYNEDYWEMNGSCSDNFIETIPVSSATSSSNIQSHFKIEIQTTRLLYGFKKPFRSKHTTNCTSKSQFDRSFNNPRNTSAERVLPIVVLFYCSYL